MVTLPTEANAIVSRGGTSGERRANRRSRSGQMRLTFLGTDHTPLNWSESGALITDRHPELAVGSTIAGIVTLGLNSFRFRFSAQVVRRDSQTKHIAIQFTNPSAALRRALADSTD